MVSASEALPEETGRRLEPMLTPSSKLFFARTAQPPPRSAAFLAFVSVYVKHGFVLK
jgi:hypothetical protein